MTSADETHTTPTLRRAYLTIDRMQRRLEEYARAASEPVAVVGLGCRLPGGVVDGDSYWRLLSTGTDAITEIPADRWDAAALHSPQPAPGKMSTRWGGFLDGLDRFDHEFFGISRREALTMDPQQRLALEVAWEALENAGWAPTSLAGSRTGVFMGVSSFDYATEHLRHPLDLTAHASTGSAHSVVPGRISYTLDLHGPSLAIDTACSSALVAVLQACQSLRSGECEAALAGGVNVVLSPLPSISFSQFGRMVSTDGRCKAFDASANGYVRSEGCGIVALKLLSHAVRDEDPIVAVVRGGAVNQDGRSAGVTAPNGSAQRDVLRRALKASGLEAHDVGYIEAHGTGTRLGDPIEVEALAEIYGRPQGPAVYLGSSKTNIGHPEAAAGIAGLIKALLCVQRDAIAPNVHFERLNPDISFAGTTFAVPTRLTPWPQGGRGRVAAVSAFGFSGTNAHLLVEQAPAREPAPSDSRRPRSVLALSAKSDTALAGLARRYAERMAAEDEADVADLCFSANTGRSAFRHRLAVVGGTRGELTDRLARFARDAAAPDGSGQDAPVDGLVTGQARGGEVVFLFTGQGPQRPGMARALYEGQPVFRETLEHCDRILRPMLEKPLLDVLYPADPRCERVNETGYAQPALFAVEYALAQMWRSWGVEPVAVLGHSFGEYVAACFAGAMSLEDGLALTVARSRLMQTLADTGAMATVFAPEAAVAEQIAGEPDAVSVAAVNGPANTTISGERRAVAAACARFEAGGVKTKLLRITTSSHSPLVEPILAPLRQAAQAVAFTPPRVPLVSNVTGDMWAWDQAPDADYWCRHARQPVRFAAGVSTLLDLGYDTLLEVGPAPTLVGLVSDALPAGSPTLLLPSLRPKHDDWDVLLTSLAQLYVHGAQVDWKEFDRGYRRRRVAVPTYAFDPTACWQERRDHAAERADDEPGASGPEDTGHGQGGQFDDGDLMYELAWQRVDVSEVAGASEDAPAPETVAHTWLVLADGTGIGDELVTALRRRGSRCVRVGAGASYVHDSDHDVVLRAADPGDLPRLLSELDLDDDEELRVVHLWSLDTQEDENTSVERLLADQQHACMSAVRAVQALAGPTAERRSTRLWLVTRGAVQPAAVQPEAVSTAAVPTAAVSTAQAAPVSVGPATLWGLGRSLQQEHRGIWGGLIDLDPEGDACAAAGHLLAALDGAGGEDQLAVRAGRRYAARLVRWQPARSTVRRAVWRKDASYLITGGLGGVGLAVARSLVRAGARHLVLAGRTPLPPRSTWATLAADDPAGSRVAAVRDLEGLGANVLVESLDVADEEAVRAFLERFAAEARPPIRGVVHAAGVGDVTALLDLEPDELERHLRPKAAGAWALHRAFNDYSAFSDNSASADAPLDFFVLFSSASSVLSSPFAAGYAAANAFLDNLARLRRAQGKPGLSINWGIWSQTGMATHRARATPGLSDGMASLSPAQALRVLHRLLPQDAPQLAVVPVDWAAWGGRYRELSGSRVLSALLDTRVQAPGARVAVRRSPLPSREELLGLPAAERTACLTDRLLQSVAATLRASSVGPEQSLFDLGLDSLMAVELRNDIEAHFGVTLPIAVFLEGASVRSLAGRILGQLETMEGCGPAREPQPIERVERFGDVAARLLEQLERMPEQHAPAAAGPEV
ncbi:type I polyketide synthase [Actinocrinis puniceicyclus]|uniref:Type I polyketide synthase n=1 Tax=Actinocrinis puniceicyclus TaxID=977794 RepID=A0A8J7WP23_9ACTN|nr:type I polyketide synthase [Actinocrinis puniceicyclus]MBS2962970.1 type I polyketide synthase [Actinocrinis puniceicyclus]